MKAAPEKSGAFSLGNGKKIAFFGNLLAKCAISLHNSEIYPAFPAICLLSSSKLRLRMSWTVCCLFP